MRADGSTAVVVAVRDVAGTAPMWDLTVSRLHDFAVGTGAYVVHNCDFKTFKGNNRDVFQSDDEAKAAYRTINRAKAGARSWAEDGTPFRNDTLDLPGKRYTEWTVHYDDTVLGNSAQRGLRRIVLGNDGSVWYTRNHYGDEWARGIVGGPSFYELWWR